VIGTTLEGKYRIDRLLGSGGMGSVYAAEDVDTGRKVAIKVIHAHLASGVRGFIERFEREAQAAASIDTDHIARCLAVGTDPRTGNQFMVLEYLVGEDLQQALKRLGPLAPELALRIVAQACVGLQKAHEAGIIHRDIKPANLFLAKAGEGERILKILDFGVAKVRKDVSESQGDTGGGLTRTGSILGSPLYMSPEQARSVKYIDHRSDIWSMGVVLYQALAGRTPYDHIAGLGDLILALCSEHPPPVQQFAPWIGPEVASIVDYALRIDPNERYQSARELHDALLPLIQGTEIRDDMIVALDDETHDHIAPTYFRGIKTSAGTHAANLQRATAATALADLPAGSTSDATPGAAARTPRGSSTGSGLSGETTGSGGRRSSMLPTVAIAVGCVLAGGAGVYAFTRTGAQPTAPAATEAPVRAAPTASATTSAEAPVVTPVTSATASAAAEAPSSSATAAPGKLGTSPGTLYTARSKPTAAPSARSIPLDSRSYGDRK
jgi:eukaryotic-like serine/threonine-protein kinase